MSNVCVYLGWVGLDGVWGGVFGLNWDIDVLGYGV